MKTKPDETADTQDTFRAERPENRRISRGSDPEVSESRPAPRVKSADQPEKKQPPLSRRQREFLEQERRHRTNVRIVRVMMLVLLLALWELFASFGVIDAFIFSSPSRIAACFLRMSRDGSIFLHTGVTLLETLVSFGLVVVIATAAAMLLWISRSLAEILEPYLVMLNSLPKSAMAPLLIVWLGNNMRTIIVAAVSVAVFGSILTLYTGFRQTDPDKIRLIASLGGTRRDVLLKVLIPSSVPLIISNMKVNVGLCLVGVIIGEFLSARAGLGYLIIYASQVLSRVHILTRLHIVLFLGLPNFHLLTLQAHDNISLI